jgi:hypothetical protein
LHHLYPGIISEAIPVIKKKRESSPYWSIQEALRILKLPAARSPRGVTELVTELGLVKSSVSRLLKGLAKLDDARPHARRGPYHGSARILLLVVDRLTGQDDGLLSRNLLLGSSGRAHLDLPLALEVRMSDVLTGTTLTR